MKNILVAITAVALSGAASADLALSAHLGPLALQLTDLKLDDGVQPLLQITEGDSQGRITVTLPNRERRVGAGFYPLLLPGSSSLTAGAASATLSHLGSGSLDSFSMSADGKVLGGGQDYGLWLSAFSWSNVGLTLSAHTRLDVVATATVSLSGELFADPRFRRNFSSYASLGLGEGVLGSPGDLIREEFAVVSVASPFPALDLSGERILRASFVNDTAFDRQIYLASTVSIISDMTSPVPEPSRLAMLMAGAGLFGLVRSARWRRR